jgi:signal peptidase II
VNSTINPKINPKLSSKRLAFLPLAFAVVLLDQLGKFQVARTLEVGARVPLIGDLLALTHIPVAGGAFGFFRDWAPAAQLIGFALLSIVATLVIVAFYRGLARGEHGSAAALGAILGGIVSNTIDRVRYGSGVDFLHLGSVEAEALPDFNLADIAIVLGVVTLILELLATEMAARVSERPRG